MNIDKLQKIIDSKDCCLHLVIAHTEKSNSITKEQALKLLSSLKLHELEPVVLSDHLSTAVFTPETVRSLIQKWIDPSTHILTHDQLPVGMSLNRVFTQSVAKGAIQGLV
jgi:hypothetical protein